MLRLMSSGVLSLAFFFASLSAQAIPVLWTLNGVTFEDNATAFGSFVYDADVGPFGLISMISVQTTAGDDADSDFFGSSYADPNPNFMSPSQVVFLSAPASGDLTGETDLALSFLSPLTNAGGTTPIHIGFSSFEAICSNNGCTGLTTFRNVIDGSVTGVPVPEPTTLALLGAGLIGLLLRRKRVA